MTAGGNTSATSQDVFWHNISATPSLWKFNQLRSKRALKAADIIYLSILPMMLCEVSVVHLYIYKKNAYTPPSQVEHALSWVWKHTLLLELYLCLSSPLSPLPPPPSSHQQEGLALLKVSSHWKGVFCHCCLFEGQTLRISEAHRDDLDWFRPITVWHAYLRFLGWDVIHISSAWDIPVQ